MSSNNLPDSFTRVIRSVVPAFDGSGDRLIEDYDVDSFDLMVLRTVLEKELNLRYEDMEWVKIKRFSDCVTFATSAPSGTEGFLESGSGRLEREYRLNMPQMNVSGLSEYWYLKEIGDMHWRTIASVLDVPSDRILDQAGRRLYATFVRIRFTSTDSFRIFQENDPIRFSGELTRFGNFFLSENILGSGNRRVHAELVTSFVARGAGNSELHKSVAVEEPKVPLRQHPEMPSLIEGYHRVRKNDFSEFGLADEALYEDTYRLDPFHDINGVGLLYFAAYPHIFDVCERAYMNRAGGEKDWSFAASTKSRDIYYLGNADLSDEIVYRLRKRVETAGVLTFVSELLRKSDGKRVSFCVVKKERAV